MMATNAGPFLAESYTNRDDGGCCLPKRPAVACRGKANSSTANITENTHTYAARYVAMVCFDSEVCWTTPRGAEDRPGTDDEGTR